MIFETLVIAENVDIEITKVFFIDQLFKHLLLPLSSYFITSVPDNGERNLPNNPVESPRNRLN